MIDVVISESNEVYNYKSSGFDTPVSSDEEKGPQGLDFDEDTTYRDVKFELGMQFATMELFKKALKDIKEFKIKRLHDQHTCGKDYKSNLAYKKWIVEKLVKRLKSQLKLTPRKAMEHMKQHYNMQLNAKIITRALKAARYIMLGNENEQFGKMRDYLVELHKSNPGSTMHMGVNPQPQGPPLFESVHISLDACKRGFKTGCRPLIGLDEYFLKGYYRGQMLSAVTQGLIKAVSEVLPNAHHQNYTLHIWKNCELRFRDKNVKLYVMAASRYTMQIQFKATMDRLKAVNLGAWEYMSKFKPSRWCKAFFSHYPKNDAVTNNIFKVWNVVIVEAREKPILILCQELRYYIIKKMEKHKRILRAYTRKFAPAQQMRLDRYIKPKRVSYVHAIAAISRVRVMAAEDFVSPFLMVDAIRKTYDICINPVPIEVF
nr:uncharacterized protein LOC112742805 [Arachis hypogaea]